MPSNPFKIFDHLAAKKNLKLPPHDEWTENVFLNSTPKAELSHSKNEFLGLALSKKKLLIITALFLFLLLIILSKSIYLQIVKGDYYHQVAEKNRVRIEKIKAQRGVIYDRNNSQLVQNIPNFAVYITPIDLPDDENENNKILTEIYRILKDNLQITQEEFLTKLECEIKEFKKNSSASILVQENLDQNSAVLLKILSSTSPGVNLMLESKRKYLLDNKTGETKILSLSHLLGYIGRINKENYENLKNKDYSLNDYIGITGLEAYYEDTLRGKDGKKQIEVDAFGKIKKTIAEEDPVQGEDLVLSIDLDLQEFAEKTLLKYLNINKNKRGSVIIEDPRNGEILAMVSLPAFDNNSFSSGISLTEYQNLINNPDKPLFNRSVAGEYPSGSTFKPVVSAAALEEGIITENTTILSQGGIKINQWFFPDWKTGGHGLTNVTKALAESVNTFFYMIGGGYKDFNGLGVENITKYAHLFGLGQQSGIDITGEKDGFLPSEEWKEKIKNEQWYIGDTYHYSIGQGDILVTPLQISNMISVFANNGILYKPYFVKTINFNQNTSEINSEIIRKDFIKKENIEIVKRGLRQAVLYGSAKSLFNLPVDVAGKTGTAEWGTDKTPHAWFTGFAPYKNPELVITVLIEESGEGSDIAVPIAKEILFWYFTRNS